MKNYSTLEVTQSNNTTKINLNRPQLKNAFNQDLMKDLTHCFEELRTSNSRLVILSGNGSDFCSGADLTWMNDNDTANSDKNSKLILQMYLAIANCDLPIVCHVFGRVYAGGIGLCAAADVVVAEENTIFCLSEVRVGLAPALMAPILINRIGVSRFRELTITARKFGVQEALHMGLLDYQFQSENFESKFEALVHEMVQASPSAIRATKQICRELGRNSLETHGNYLSGMLTKLRDSEEARDGIAAFKEKRKAKWSKNDNT